MEKHNSFVVRNSRMVLEDRILDGHDLVVVDGWITALTSGQLTQDWQNLPVVDAQGAWLLPGLFDIHSDYIEHVAAPRPRSVMDFTLALRVAERELAAHGITTMFHSLSLFKHSEFGANPIRSPENVERLMSLIHDFRHRPHLIHHRFHARFEIDYLEMVDTLERYLQSGQIDLLSFMDHSPGQGQYRDLETFRKTLAGYHQGMSDADFQQVLQRHQGKDKLTFQGMADLARLAQDHGVAVASHDDDTVEKLALVGELGVRISEFPITMEVAAEARRRGMHTVLGAPNILLGGSHSGNLGAADAILAGNVDILCSDYYPPALLASLFIMTREHRLPLWDMVALASLNAAKAVGMDRTLGSISPGKEADLLLVRELEEGLPQILVTWTGGVPVYRCEYRPAAGKTPGKSRHDAARLAEVLD